MTLLMVALLTGCAPRPGSDDLHPAPPPPEARVLRVYVVSTRAPDPPPQIGFGTQPSAMPQYRSYDIAVSHDGPPRVTAWKDLTKAAFLDQTAARSRGRDGGLGVFVHGFNNTFAESLLNFATLARDGDPGIVPVLFAWPSAGHPLEYEADRQSALLSRDALAALLDDLTGPGRPQLLVFGHSMGGALTLEALRTLRLKGDLRTLNNLKVVLAAPDVDLFMFDRQMRVIGPLVDPMVVLVSPDDRALALSSRLGGGRPRLGAIAANNPGVARAAQRAGVVVLDISALPADPLNHRRFEALARYVGANQTDKPLDLRTAGAFVLNSVDRSLLRPALTGP
ncbi:alpha/beta hydrolase [Paracoccus zhouxuedongae]|uniref:alpha/beta hydrolase n=1 Tax=unclassified Paracoccus (in: a-proteobacteria) TaxID=2688777 RepID=UPI0035BC1354